MNVRAILPSDAEGVAKQFFESAFNDVKAQSYLKFVAYARSDNQRALVVYLKQGFEVIGTAQKQTKVKGVFFDEVMIGRWL